MPANQKVNIEDILLHHKMWLEAPDGQGILGDGTWKLPKAV